MRWRSRSSRPACRSPTFDDAALDGAVVLRAARAGETIADGEYAHDVPPGRLVLADAAGPVAVLFGRLSDRPRAAAPDRAAPPRSPSARPACPEAHVDEALWLPRGAVRSTRAVTRCAGRVHDVSRAPGRPAILRRGGTDVVLLDHPTVAPAVDERAARRRCARRSPAWSAELVRLSSSPPSRTSTLEPDVPARRPGRALLGLGELERGARASRSASARPRWACADRADLEARGARAAGGDAAPSRGRHKWVSLPDRRPGRAGVRRLPVRPRLGLIGMLMGGGRSSSPPAAR